MVKMDSTKKPILIPPDFSHYADKHGIFGIYEQILNHILIHQPDDPLQAIIDWLTEPQNVPRIMTLGPPVSGKRTISRELCNRLRCVYICRENFQTDNDAELVKAIKARLTEQDCVEKGWLFEGMPENREQALGLQAAGIFPKHVFVLEAADAVLMERLVGKRVDLLTGDVYHVTFNPPMKPEILSRLKVDPKASEDEVKKQLTEYRRNIDGVTRCYNYLLRVINADQPKVDVMEQIMEYLSISSRNNAPYTPKVILIGPPGSGKSVQASLLEKKYGIVDVNCDELIKQKLVDESDIGQAMKPFLERGGKIPDELVVKVIEERLGCMDAVKRGWVLHAFPTTRNQVDVLSAVGHHPNRVFVLDVPNEVVVERISLRRLDLDTGTRYHVMYKPPICEAVKSRLVTHPDDEEAAVMKRCADYQAHLDDILEFYEHTEHIDGDRDMQTVFENIESLVVNPLPKKIK